MAWSTFCANLLPLRFVLVDRNLGLVWLRKYNNGFVFVLVENWIVLTKIGSLFVLFGLLFEGFSCY